MTKKVLSTSRLELQKTLSCCYPVGLRKGEPRPCCVNKLVVPCKTQSSLATNPNSSAFQMVVSEGPMKKVPSSDFLDSAKEKDAPKILLPEVKGKVKTLAGKVCKWYSVWSLLICSALRHPTSI